MKDNAPVLNFPLSLLMKILFMAAFIIGCLGMVLFGEILFTYWRDASVFSVYLLWDVLVSILLLVGSFVYLFRYRLSVDSTGIRFRAFGSEEYFSFSRITGMELGQAGLSSVMVLYCGKKRLRIDSYFLRGDGFEKLILLVKEGVSSAARDTGDDGMVFSSLKANSCWWRSGGLIFIGYLVGALAIPYFAPEVSDRDIGTVLYYGIGCERDREKADDYLGDSCEANEGRLEKEGLAALDKYREGEKDVSSEEAYQIGCLYAGGVGVEKDAEEALKWFRIAIDTGKPYMRKKAGFLMKRIGS